MIFCIQNPLFFSVVQHLTQSADPFEQFEEKFEQIVQSVFGDNGADADTPFVLRVFLFQFKFQNRYL